MAGVLHGTASWPGALSIEACSGSISHGITPGTFVLRIHPQLAFPAVFGTLTISDGNETVVLPGCKMDALKIEQDDSGIVWSLEIVDRRWRWRDLGLINGWYNQQDPHGKLIPWTIRSPTELAQLCLDAMGQANAVLNLPPGLDSSVGIAQQTMLPTGINYPSTGTNPPIDWKGVPPAQALQQVAEMFGCRVVYQHATDTVLVTPSGVGAFLPPGSIHKQGPSVKSPETPDAVGVIGAPTRFQARMGLIAVGEEWDGSYRPLSMLSYAPLALSGLAGKVQISTVTLTNDPTTSGVIFQIFLAASADQSSNQGVLFEYTTILGDTDTFIATTLAGLINASTDQRVQGKLTAATAVVDGMRAVILTGTNQGFAFGCYATLSGTSSPPDGDSINASLTQAAIAPKKAGQAGDWSMCFPPIFPGVRATDRLTIEQARSLAQKSVWRCYQILDSANIPVYGPVLRRQILLTDTQVDQIVPQPGDQNIKTALGNPFVANIYNGYSKDKPAAVYGSIYAKILGFRGLVYKIEQPNTDKSTQVYVPFSTDPIWQIVTFSDYVYQLNGAGGIQDPNLVLQTAVNIRNLDTNAVECFTKIVPIPGQNSLTNPKMEVHSDVQLNVTATWDAKNNIKTVSVLEADPILRANYYLEGMVQRYLLSDAQTLDYNGIRNIQLDGAISQVSWNIGEAGGCFTVASRNTEHDYWVPSYPARRRAELLPSIAEQQRDQRKQISRG